MASGWLSSEELAINECSLCIEIFRLSAQDLNDALYFSHCGPLGAFYLHTQLLRVLLQPKSLPSSLQSMEILLSEIKPGVVIHHFSNCYYLGEIETEPKPFSFHKLEAEI